jgi:hypothetical protein
MRGVGVRDGVAIARPELQILRSLLLLAHPVRASRGEDPADVRANSASRDRLRSDFVT